MTCASGAFSFIASTKNGASRLAKRIVVVFGSMKKTFPPPLAMIGDTRAEVESIAALSATVISDLVCIGARAPAGAGPALERRPIRRLPRSTSHRRSRAAAFGGLRGCRPAGMHDADVGVSAGDLKGI